MSSKQQKIILLSREMAVVRDLKGKVYLTGAVILGLAVIYLVILFILISIEGEKEETKNSADVIIILGSPPNPDGTPNIIIKSRVEKGANLYKNGKAKKIILTGGPYNSTKTEAEVMQTVALGLGVPSQDIILEKKADNTEQSAINCQSLMKKHHFQTAFLVTDSFHMKRSLFLFKKEKVTVYPSPVKNNPAYQNRKFYYRLMSREVFALTYYYVKRLFK